MAQAVSHRPLTAEARVLTQFTPRGICIEYSGTDTCFCQSSSVFPCQYKSTAALHTRIIWGMNNRPVGGRSSETWCHHIDMSNNC
jgi:hypothetical protein